MASAGGSQSEPERKKQFIVLVDPNPDDLFESGMLLQRFEYNVFTTGTGEEALQYMAIAMPSAVITDLLLPGMTGMDLISRIRQDNRTRDVPVIVQTSMKDPKVEELCKLAGCAAYLRKPVEHNTLYRAVQRAIEATPRSYVRLSTCLPVRIGDEEPLQDEWVAALSENGLFIRTLIPRPVNAVLPVTFFLGERAISVRAMVLYVFGHGSGPLKEPGMGMKFSQISEQDRRALQDFIKDELMRDLIARDRHKWQHEEDR